MILGSLLDPETQSPIPIPQTQPPTLSPQPSTHNPQPQTLKHQSSTCQCYLLLAVDARVRLFIEEAEGMCGAGMGPGGSEPGEGDGGLDGNAGPPRADRLRTCLDRYTDEVLLPRIKKDYNERMRDIIQGAEVWTKVASSSTATATASSANHSFGMRGSGVGTEGREPVLESAVATDRMLEELLALAAALPAYAAEIGKLWDSVLGAFATAADGAVKGITQGSRVQNIVSSSRDEASEGLLRILDTDPLLMQLEREVKEIPPRLDLVTREEMEAFYCIEALRIDPVLLAAHVGISEGGAAGVNGSGAVEDWSADRMLDNEIPLLACLHHSLFWLLSRQFSRREDLFTKGWTVRECLHVCLCVCVCMCMCVCEREIAGVQMLPSLAASAPLKTSSSSSPLNPNQVSASHAWAVCLSCNYMVAMS